MKTATQEMTKLKELKAARTAALYAAQASYQGELEKTQKENTND
tara:strand:+ start:61 stop:192 length:132 start_codon:yes stop_codon:yes gene_type:complete